MELNSYQRYLLTKVSIEAMKILNLPVLPIKFEPFFLGDNNAAINSNATDGRSLMFSTILSKNTDRYVDWYQLIAHEMIHHKQMEEGRLRAEFAPFYTSLYWEDRDVTGMLYSSYEDKEHIAYYVLPWEQEANMGQEALGMMLKKEIGTDFDKAPSLAYRIKAMISGI
jgi:hypothetical protein